MKTKLKSLKIIIKTQKKKRIKKKRNKKKKKFTVNVKLTVQEFSSESAGPPQYNQASLSELP